MLMSKRVALYERLPEIYRIKDEEQFPPGQLKAYLEAMEKVFEAIHANIESLYHDFFIDTCDDWVIPYIADLVGTSHLSGESSTLRADVADTIFLRRRKGTLSAIERLAANLTGWAARSVELRENLGWRQHLNHLRPDIGGEAPYSHPSTTRFTIRRGGTLPIRDPAQLSLLGTPFDRAAYTPVVRPPTGKAIHYNLPNLAIFLWRLEAYRLRAVRPLAKGYDTLSPSPGEAKYVVKFDLHQLDRSARLFNTYRNDPNADPPRLTAPDEVPGPIPAARLTSGSEDANPFDYIGIDEFDPGSLLGGDLNISESGLQLFLPENPFAGVKWTFRGANLCAWSSGLKRPVALHEIVIDPILGRVAIGVDTATKRNALTPKLGDFARNVLAGFTYGAPGNVGAHPVSRDSAPVEFGGEATTKRTVNTLTANQTLVAALEGLTSSGPPVVVEIEDSLVHDLDISGILNSSTLEDVAPALKLSRSLIIRAASGHRPIVRLAQPLRFRPASPEGADRLTVRLEGLYLTQGWSSATDDPLVARAALDKLEILNCTLDPGGYRLRDGARAPIRPAIQLEGSYGFVVQAEEDLFEQTPQILIQRSICGPLLIDAEYYTLSIEHSVVDAGKGVSDKADDTFAITDSTNSATLWGPDLVAINVTFFGRVRVVSASGSGTIWSHRLEVHNNQTGCIKNSSFRGDQDRLPHNYACVSGAEVRFGSEWFEQPDYGHLSCSSDTAILTLGPGDDRMGAFGAVNKEAHKWANLRIRIREFMPLGVRPILIAVT
ncbi:MAG: hypothetical protein JSW34_10405 [Candidatus Zixiibacteriota bacterium]|nr:MAG: hypothetical protein JSW34_10405 [candidate division Zixibacteria bacterium]